MPYQASMRSPGSMPILPVVLLDSSRKKPPPIWSYGDVGVLEAPVNTRLSSPVGQRNTESPNDVSANVLPDVDGGCGGAGRYLPATRMVAQLSRSRPSPGNRTAPGTKAPRLALPY